MPDTQKLKKRLRRKVHYDTAVLVLMFAVYYELVVCYMVDIAFCVC